MYKANTINSPLTKENNYISHIGDSDKKKSSFATPFQNPYWPDNLWNDEAATLVYNYRHPEMSLPPPNNKGDQTIRFDSRFESGNLLYAYKLNPTAYHCILENDHSHSEQCQWFYFQMSNIQIVPNSNRRITFYISGFNKSNNILSNGSKVFMYSEKSVRDKNLGWTRAGTNYAYGTSFKPNSPPSRRRRSRNKFLKPKNYTLQFQITFPYDDDIVYLCYGIPYTYTDLNTHITQWIRTSSTIFTSATLCQTNKGKNCPILTITAPISPSKNISKKCIFITSRNHPGESNASFILHGFINYLLSKQSSAEYLINHFIFKIIPMINIDGVIDGCHHVGLDGENLNQIWGNPDRLKHPVVYHIKNLMSEIQKQTEIVAFIDFHGTSSEHGTFLYGCPYNESDKIAFSQINKEKLFPKILDSLCDYFSIEKCQYPLPKAINDPPRSVIRRTFGVINSFSIKSSLGGIIDGIWTNSLYNENSWKEIGAKVAESLFHLFSEKPSFLLKSIENKRTFSNSNSLKSKLNSSFDFSESNNGNSTSPRDELLREMKRKAEADEKATVMAIDTADGIKILGGGAGINQSYYMSQMVSPSSLSSPRYNSSTKQSYNTSSSPVSKFNLNSDSNSNNSSSIFSRPRSNLSSESNSTPSNPRFRSSPISNRNNNDNNNSTSSQNRSPSPKASSRQDQSFSPKAPSSSSRSPSPKSNWKPNSDAKSNSNVRINMNSSSDSKPTLTSRFGGDSKSNWNSNSESKSITISRTNPNTRANLNSSSESKQSSNTDLKSNWSSKYASNNNSNIRTNINSNTKFASSPNTTTKSSPNNKTNSLLSSDSDSKSSFSSKYSSSQYRSFLNYDQKSSLTSRTAPQDTNSRLTTVLRPNSSLKSNINSDSVSNTSRTTSSNQKPTVTHAKPTNSNPRSSYALNSESNSSSSFAPRTNSSLKTNPYSYSNKHTNVKTNVNPDSSDIGSRSFGSRHSENCSYSNITATEVASSYSSLLSNSSININPNSSFKNKSSSSNKRVTFQIDIFQKKNPHLK